ncbi:MAG: SCP2 sterol-binding domain-containing protein [Candidatus Thorarchaeota archaeon]
MGIGKDTVIEFVNSINNSEEIRGMLKNWEKVAMYKLDGEDGPFHVLHKADGSAEFVEGSHEKPSFTIVGPGQIWADIAAGKEDAQKAFFAKKYKIEGDVMGTMKLLPVIKKLQS